MFFFFFFFFSSRRRHTRFDCDWSSDVCSSDLISPRCANDVVKNMLSAASRMSAHSAGTMPPPATAPLRSEERRVGKEGGLRGWRMIEKKKKKERKARSRRSEKRCEERRHGSME